MKVSNQPALITRRMRPFMTLFAALTVFGAHAQQSAQHEVVMYDPIFWKDELSLRNNQSRRIEEINTEFYETIRHLKEERPTREANNTVLERGLQERSQKIFETLLPKQRRKLEKIIDKTAPITAP